jgi:hypothetical protein
VSWFCNWCSFYEFQVPSKNFKGLQTRKSHSWWWDSHISPKNSKWHTENLEGELLISRCPFSFKDLLVEQKCAWIKCEIGTDYQIRVSCRVFGIANLSKMLLRDKINVLKGHAWSILLSGAYIWGLPLFYHSKRIVVRVFSS